VTVYRYDEISVPAVRNLKCAKCTKRFRRQHTFTATVNPFNKNPDGTVRTPREIRAVLSKQASEWSPRNVCTGCDTTEWD
jgi:hypothetical protein